MPIRCPLGGALQTFNMTIIQDPISAVIQYLKDDAGIAALVITRIFGSELPKAQASSMPRKAIVCKNAGGASQASYLKLNDFRIDFFCYGEEPYEAMKVLRTLHDVMKQLERSVKKNTLIHDAIQSGGPTAFRDPDTGWPVAVETWMVSISEEIIV